MRTTRLRRVDIDLALAVSLASIACERDLVLKRTGRELVGPCLHCGGHDRFAINLRKIFSIAGAAAAKGAALSRSFTGLMLATFAVRLRR